ncbi:MAG: LacI family transcriptional regulator [Sulfobacillus acidophilus]|uniref:LacI family transcriptional regulator n=1 Tax=Sulfobacillus acidophilus TaxID=53633 RepID=A0A2T2WCH0_9FIRM|nr:MAG: LacI family transcriptional regulator [Sulfobacillus acidophilus]
MKAHSYSSTRIAGTAKGPKTIEFIPTSSRTPYFLDEYAGVQNKAKLYGYKTIYEAPSTPSVAAEIQLMREAITNKVSGIVLVPYSPSGLVNVSEQAEKAGIPVIATDSNMNAGKKTFIAVDDTVAAEAIARWAETFVHGKGQYAIIDYSLSDTSGIDRRNGFEAAMKKFPGMKFAGIQISNSVVQTALQETTTLLERNPKINVVFGANDRSALGAAEAVQKLHLQNKVCVVGFDADLGEINFIKSGVIKASALQSPYLMGQKAVLALRSVWAGKKLPNYEELPYHIVTYKNYNSPVSIAAIKQYILNYKP